MKPGVHTLPAVDLNRIYEFIDWTFFFFAWKLNGKYPSIFTDPVKGEEARKLFEDGKKYLEIIRDKKLISLSGVISIKGAASNGDDVKILNHDGTDSGRYTAFLKKPGTKGTWCSKLVPV
ncbi:MAG: vitamin B12 dependent-methionine synthase activation domain-containing protein [Bacteroidales bacterium]